LACYDTRHRKSVTAKLNKIGEAAFYKFGIVYQPRSKLASNFPSVRTSSIRIRRLCSRSRRLAAWLYRSGWEKFPTWIPTSHFLSKLRRADCNRPSYNRMLRSTNTQQRRTRMIPASGGLPRQVLLQTGLTLSVLES